MIYTKILCLVLALVSLSTVTDGLECYVCKYEKQTDTPWHCKCSEDVPNIACTFQAPPGFVCAKGVKGDTIIRTYQNATGIAEAGECEKQDDAKTCWCDTDRCNEASKNLLQILPFAAILTCVIGNLI